jgi:hypothetical protein
MSQCVKIHYRTHTCGTCFGNIVGLTIPMAKPMYNVRAVAVSYLYTRWASICCNATVATSNSAQSQSHSPLHSALLEICYWSQLSLHTCGWHVTTQIQPQQPPCYLWLQYIIKEYIVRAVSYIYGIVTGILLTVYSISYLALIPLSTTIWTTTLIINEILIPPQLLWYWPLQKAPTPMLMIHWNIDCPKQHIGSEALSGSVIAH